MMSNVQRSICRDHLPPLAFHIKTCAIVVRGVVNNQPGLGRVNDLYMLQIAQEISRFVLYKRRYTHTLERRIAIAVYIAFLDHPFFITDDNAHARGKLRHNRASHVTHQNPFPLLSFFQLSCSTFSETHSTMTDISIALYRFVGARQLLHSHLFRALLPRLNQFL